MEIGFAKPEDKDKIMAIWQYCFEDSETFVSWYFDAKYNASNTLVAYEDGLPVSSLQLVPYRLGFHNREIDISYVEGVDTLPEARGKGYAAALLKKAICEMKERGHLISLLLPFRYAFYRRYGWETCYYQKSYTFEPNDLKPLATPYGNLRPMDFNSDVDVIMQIYGAFSSHRHGYIVRTAENWRCILYDLSLEEKKGYIVEDEKGTGQGYILYGLKHKTFEIFEMGYGNKDAYRGLLWFVYAHSAQVERITWKAPADDMTFAFLADPSGGVILKPFVMARVIDVMKLLRMLCKDVSKSLELSIDVKDPIADWNNGIFRVYDGEVMSSRDVKADLSCSINTLTQMAMGFISPVQAHQMGLLHAGDVYAVEKAEIVFKVKNNFINDCY